jgi:hypothetical protein
MKVAVMRWALLAGWFILGFFYLDYHLASSVEASVISFLVTVSMYLYHFRPMYA